MTSKANILIIDDNTVFLDMIAMYLTDKQYHVLPAKNGIEGLKLFNSHSHIIDLVITDIIMPNISGTALISIIKKKRPALPVIAISGFGEHPITLAEELKADLTMGKPLVLRELESQIALLLPPPSVSTV